MRRRILALPLALLVVCGLLLASVIAIGAVPPAIAVALVSGAVAAIITSLLSLAGIWLTLRHKIVRDRFDRLRSAYADLIRAGDLVRSAVIELGQHPNGRPSPYIPHAPGTAGFTQGVTISALATPQYPPKEVAEYNPYHIADDALDRARDLVAEAEVAIYLEEGDNHPVLKAWRSLEDEYNEFRLDLVEGDAARVARRRHSLQTSLDALRATAHRELRRLRLN